MRGQHRSGLCAGRKILGFNLSIEVDLVRRPSLVERLQEPKTNVFFRAAKPDAQNSVGNLIMTRVFQIVFRHQVITNAGTQQREDGSTMRYAKKALPRDFRLLPGLHGAGRTGASQPMQKQHGTRDEGNTAHTLHARRLVLTCRLLPLAVSISFINSYISQTATTLLVLDEANIVCGCATSQLLS